MAEFGAHLTSAVSGSQPSVFDVVAQESLMSTLRPALRHACKVLAESQPANFGWLFKYSDEIYSVLDLVLQNYYLKQYAGSFAENFYGLKRVVKGQERNATKLQRRDVRKSLFYLVLVPYMKLKLDQLFEKIRLEMADGLHQSQTLKDKVSRLFATIYPMLHLVWGSSVFLYLFLYTFNKASHHSPFIYLSGVTLQTLTEEDMISQDATVVGKEISSMRLTEKLKHFIKQGLSYTAMSLSVGLSVGVFFLQFLEWWYNSDQKMTSVTSLPVPNPPKKMASGVHNDVPDICLICNRVRTNDTALAVTGYVFCYPCIYNYVKSNGRCPVTGYPCETQHLIKLYLPSS